MKKYRFPELPWRETGGPNKRERRFGFELELGGLSVSETADFIADAMGGTVEVSTRFERIVTGTQIGTVRVELDTDYLREARYRSALEALGVKPVDIRHVENFVEDFVRGLVPCEVVTEPVPISQLPRVEELREVLHLGNANGTGAAFTSAFSLQINADVVTLEADHLHAVLASFLLLYEWILDVSGIDWTRRLTPFIDPFPQEYVERVVRPDYRPTRSQLIDDYLEANPTRNRALDMLPVFMEADRDRVRKRIDDAAVKARPAFHYRLPDCRIDEPTWRVAHAMESWASVERLAADEERRHRLASAYLRNNRETLIGRGRKWVAILDEEMVTA